MALIEFKNLPNTSTPLNAENLNYNFNEILNLVYPIGRGFIDFTNTDYSNYLGFTWERELVGMMPIGISSNDTDFNTIGKTGGEKKHKLTVSEMPNHNHGIAVQYGSSLDSFLQWAQTSGNNNGQYYDSIVSSTGGNQSHNNMPPYKVVAYWKRIA